uniref:ATP-dependent DNA helicase n=1 Tax=Hordeum vulgare subsp. vulgare TaxID=112509 RepID=A0A8I6WRR5_HORVV
MVPNLLSRLCTEGNTRLCVSVRDYYCYRLQTRPAIFNPILHGARLFQQWGVDMFIKIEGCRLKWISEHQTQIRADLYQGLVDSIAAGEVRVSAVGKRIVLPGTHQGSNRDMKGMHMDAMALVQTYGKPDIFLTMTCNPSWEEILNDLLPRQTPQDRPDLVARVFRAKLETMKEMLFKKHILGVVVAYVYVVEFQKRGLPHAHFLLIMNREYKLGVPEQYDRIISAQLPDKHKYPDLYAMVVKHMMHGPCGNLNPKNVCMQDLKCKSQYPRPFNQNTLQGKDSYPVYRRRDDGRQAKVRRQMLDNRWVVPYNPYLLRMFNCHINVEVCSSIKAVKYLYKYVYKGHDRASISINQPDEKGVVDEIKRYIDARWVTPPEAMWRVFGINLSESFPSVLQLPLHLPDMHTVTFKAGEDLTDVVARDKASKSMLAEYFLANQQHVWARDILYKDFPGSFTWQRTKYWRPRQKQHQVGRIVSAHPAEGERYFLRVLLNHVPGKTSFEDLRTVDGLLCDSFRDVRGLWDRHLEAMSDDCRRSHTCSKEVEQMVLLDIRGMLQSMGKDIALFPLPDIDETYDTTGGEAREVTEESTIEVDAHDAALASSLNHEQRLAYDEILAAVDAGDGGVFFVDGPGGTEKTFLYRALRAKVRGEGKIAVVTATSGVAASIMPGDRTAHSRFKIPLNIEDGASCSFTKQSGTAKLLRMASLILWDEASMTKRQAVEALDNSIRDITGRRHQPFGGKAVVFGGDFRQVLAVVRKGSRGQIIDVTLQSSYLWKGMRQLRLITNMRAHNDPWFADYLLRVGNGIEETDDEGNISLPQDICVPPTGDGVDLEKLIDHVFPALDYNMSDPNYMTSRAIIYTKNDNVDKINTRMIERFQGEEKIYHSFDSAEDDPHGYYAPEFLNNLNPNGLPPHALKLKINCPIILLRNIDPANGLCNGTRLVVRGFQRNAIDAEIVLGQHAGRRVFLPWIPLCPSDDDIFPFKFKRKQFPIRLSFAMTINKAQGQTIPIVGVYLPYPIFSHGQLYVALSRATAKRNIKILAIKDDDKGKGKGKEQSKNSKKRKRSEPLLTTMKNIVYKEVLST